MVLGFFGLIAGEAVAENHGHYLPLAVGNSWTYTNGIEERTFTIVGTRQIDGHVYYEFNDYARVCGFPGSCWESFQTPLLRYDPNSDAVLLYNLDDGKDMVRYDFSGEVGYRWWDGHGNDISDIDINCTTPAGQFEDCYLFAFAIMVDSGVFRETMAPNVGMVRFLDSFREAGPSEFLLKSYRFCDDPDHPYAAGDLDYDCRVGLADLKILAEHWLESTAVPSHEPNAPEIHREYLPLAEGNYWIYSNGFQTRTFTIVGTRRINGQVYYEFDDYPRVCGFPGFGTEPFQVPLLRYDADTDTVLLYNLAEGRDMVRYDFSGEPGYRWWDGYGNELSAVDVDWTSQAGRFEACYRFEFAITVDCGVFTETLAPNVGVLGFLDPSIEGFETGRFGLRRYSIRGDPNHPYPAGDLNHDCRVDFLDLAILAEHWQE